MKKQMVLAALALTLMPVGLQATQQPNIILFLVDDCSTHELGCYGNTMVSTPNIDALAEGGIKFKTAWATPVCVSSRAAIMSGQYGFRNGAYGNTYIEYETYKAMPLEKMTLFRAMKESGYATFHGGKWHLPTSPEDSEWGVDEYFMYGSLMGGDGLKQEWIQEYFGPWWFWGNANIFSLTYEEQHSPLATWHPMVIENDLLRSTGPDDFGPEMLGDAVLDFAQRSKNDEKPFFIYYSSHLTHFPWTEMKAPGDPEVTKTEPGMVSNVQYLDTAVGRLVNALKAMGEYENTVIFFMADNPTYGIGKGAASEIGAHVPFIVAGGSNWVKWNGETGSLTDCVDLYPTLLELAGHRVLPSQVLDGQSLVPLLEGDHAHSREWIFSYVLGFHRMIRNRDYSLDAQGQLWRCNPSGNPFTFEKIETYDEASQNARMELESQLEHLPIPDEDRMEEKPIIYEQYLEFLAGQLTWRQEQAEDLYQTGVQSLLNRPERLQYDLKPAYIPPQAATYQYTSTLGTWSETNNWEYWPVDGWVAATNLPGTNDNVRYIVDGKLRIETVSPSIGILEIGVDGDANNAEVLMSNYSTELSVTGLYVANSAGERGYIGLWDAMLNLDGPTIIGKDGGNGRMVIGSKWSRADGDRASTPPDPAEAFVVGYSTNAVGVLDVNGTLSLVNNFLYVGYDGATGTVNQAGPDSFVKATQLRLGHSGDGVATYNLTGGELRMSSQWGVYNPGPNAELHFADFGVFTQWGDQTTTISDLVADGVITWTNGQPMLTTDWELAWTNSAGNSALYADTDGSVNSGYTTVWASPIALPPPEDDEVLINFDSIQATVDVNINGGLDVDTNTNKVRNLSLTSLLFDSTLDQHDMYGGCKSQYSLDQVNYLIAAESAAKQNLRFRPWTRTDPQDYIIDAVVLWDQADFMDGFDMQTVVFTSQSSFTLEVDGGFTTGTGYDVRMVVRDGASQYYVSETVAPDGTTITVTNPDSLQWATYDLVDGSGSFAFADGGIGSYGAHSFTDVQRVGFAFNHSYGTAKAADFSITKFVVKRVDTTVTEDTPATRYADWLSAYPGVGSELELTDNPDGDALDNLAEYALNGNPDDESDIGIAPVASTEAGWFYYVHAQRDAAAERGLIYRVLNDTDLVLGVFTNTDAEVVGTNTGYGISGFETVTNRVPTDVLGEQFLKLEVESSF
ncbi:sulfatase-like hydrolase/transferase [Pontiella desulfatans]|nr:sulfatase-like hydrolase/transferase [Pontiella desulfatans]